MSEWIPTREELLYGDESAKLRYALKLMTEERDELLDALWHTGCLNPVQRPGGGFEVCGTCIREKTLYKYMQ